MQITGNLISNAIKFTPENGTVSVRLALETDDVENILNIAVADTGGGIDRPAINAILSGSAASTNGTIGEQGFGFGLTLVKHLVDSLQGRMEIFSEPGLGSTFQVYLPQKQL